MPDQDLVDRIADSTGLSPGEARRVVDDVLAWYREPVADVVRRRHHEQIAAELRARLVAAPELSVRQLRRLVYG